MSYPEVKNFILNSFTYFPQGVELELRKLEEAVEVIHENLLYLRKR